MALSDNSLLQNYTAVSDINLEHGIRLVKEQPTGRLYVMKVLSTYHLPVYQQLQARPVPGIPGIHALFEKDGHLVVLEEYVAGETLEDQLARRGSFPAREVRSVGLQLCEILMKLEAMTPPVIHRDIKPSNIIRSLSGSLTLLDLNAAKHANPTQSSDTQLIGTQGYAAPEQYGFGPSVIQTDIYAVGMVMNAMLSGQPTRTVASGCPLDPVIEKCLKMDPQDRYASAAELSAALMQSFVEDTAAESRSNAASAGNNAFSVNQVSFENRAAFGSHDSFGNRAASASRDSFGNRAASASRDSFGNRAASGSRDSFGNRAASASRDSSSARDNSTENMSSRIRPWMRFLPPGFRTLNPLHMIAAITGYVLIVYFTSAMVGVGENGDLMTWPTRITFLLLCAVVIICTFNYLGIQRFFPPCRSKKRWVRVLGIVLMDAIGVVITFVICVFVISLILP